MGKFLETVKEGFKKGLKWGAEGALAGAVIGAAVLGGVGALVFGGGELAALAAVLGAVGGGITGAKWAGGAGAVVGGIDGYHKAEEKEKEQGKGKGVEMTTAQKAQLVGAQNDRMEQQIETIGQALDAQRSARQQAAGGYDNPDAKGGFAANMPQQAPTASYSDKAKAASASAQATANSVA